MTTRVRSLLVAAALAVAAPPSAGQVQETDLKAAFIYNFARYAEWPSERAAEGRRMIFCAHPDNPLLPALEGLEGKLVRGQRIAVRALADPSAAPACHVLVLGASDRSRWLALLRAVHRVPVLTVADDASGGYDGAMLTLDKEGDKIVFDVNVRAAARARLQLSSKLLRLGRMVQ